MGVRNRWNPLLSAKAPRKTQRFLGFQARTLRLERRFRRTLAAATLLAVALLWLAFPRARARVESFYYRAKLYVVEHVIGLSPDRAAVEAEWTARRTLGIANTRRVLERFYGETTPRMRELFRVAGMDPDHGLIRYGRGDQAFLISPQVFELDTAGRSYRMRPNVRSVWLRQITLNNGPFGMFQVLDDLAHRQAAAQAGAIVDEGSAQVTNSWGLRGPEPNPAADVRGIVLGDSFMQGMFNGDGDTPPIQLERALAEAWNVPVSILNTGCIGYSPEQYYYSLKAFGDRFQPKFVVVSVCPNDFGDGWPVLMGQGDWWHEAEYWLDQILTWCRARRVECVLVPVPTYVQIENGFHEIYYPGMVREIFHSHPSRYCDPFNEFLDESLREGRLAAQRGLPSTRSALYNRPIDDDHFSPRGAALWARVVGRRLALLLDPPARASKEHP